MSNLDLQKEFIECLLNTIPQKQELTYRIADILKIEKESAYRRLTGRVSFSLREMGMICQTLSISIDRLLTRNLSYVLLPLYLNSPSQYESMDYLANMVDSVMQRLEIITQAETDVHHIMNVLPAEFYIYSPAILKFMFFKWGHYFVGTSEFSNFSSWEIPEGLRNFSERLIALGHIERSIHICDHSIIWNLVIEIEHFYKMRSITNEDKNLLVNEIKELLNNWELALCRKLEIQKPFSNEGSFYLSTVNLGFSAVHWISDRGQSMLLQTNFSSAHLDDTVETLDRVRKWMKYLCSVSTMISDSGHVERRAFFKRQLNIVDTILG